uniref:Uncharacterized protein n=1 Tax=Chelydra serpentina TaxID=8475 RepID=A0A8C3SPX8_CHESE
IDVDVGQTHVGDNLVSPPVVVLLVDGEGLQGVVAPAVLGQGVGAGALEVEVQPVEGVIVRVPPAPAGRLVVRDTHTTPFPSLSKGLKPGVLTPSPPSSNPLDSPTPSPSTPGTIHGVFSLERSGDGEGMK